MGLTNLPLVQGTNFGRRDKIALIRNGKMAAICLRLCTAKYTRGVGDELAFSVEPDDLTRAEVKVAVPLERHTVERAKL